MGRGAGGLDRRSAPGSRDEHHGPLRSGTPTWAKVAIAGGAGAFAALVAARFLPAPTFVLALLAMAVLLATVLHALVAGLLWRLSPDRAVPAWQAALAGAAAALGGRAALASLLASRSARPTIDLLAFALAAIGGTGALSAVGWGMWGIGRRGARPSWAQTLVFTAAIAAGLYSLGPLLRSAGIPLDHWTFLSLLATGIAFFGVSRALSSR